MTRFLPVPLLFVLALAAAASDLDEGDPRCNVRVAIATTEGHKPPKDVIKLQRTLRDKGIKSELALLDRAPDLKHRVMTDWFVTVYPEDAARARRCVEDARAKGLGIEPSSADSSGPFR